MSRVVHFEIPAKDPQKVATFYRDVFGWEFTKWDGPMEYWMIKTGEDGTVGINGGVYTPNEQMTGTINTVGVEDLDAALSKVRAHGGTVAVDKMTVPGVGYLAYILDTEGTVLGLMQSDMNAS